jgi:hypothetical protein
MLAYDPENRVVFVTKFLRHNKPANPNVLKGYLKYLDQIPDESPLKQRFLEALAEVIGTCEARVQKAYAYLFGNAIGTVPEPVLTESGTVTGTVSERLPQPVRTSVSSEQLAVSSENPPTPKGADFDPQGFEQFWRAYPKKKSLEQAQRAWNKLKPDPALKRVLLDALEAQKKWPEWLKDNGQFVPYCATWINGKRWRDAPVVPIRPEPSLQGMGAL